MSAQLPAGWRLAKVADLASLVQYGSSSKTSEVETGIPVLRMGNIVDGRLIFEPLKYLPQEHDEFPELLLKPGDVLFNRTNSPELVGKTAVYSAEHPAPCSFASYLIRLRLRDYEPRLLSAYLNSGHGRAWIRSCVSQQVGQANVSGGKLRELEVPVPPLPEQRRIVAKLEALQTRSRRAREALDAVPPLLEKLRQSILAAAFRGDLTKDWRAKNKNVEPASKLLERIRAERRKKWEESELAKMNAKGKPPSDDKWKSKYKEPAPVDTTGLPKLPAGWCWASVEELSTKVVDGVHKKPTYVAPGVPFLTVKNLTAGPGISFAEVNYVTQADHEEYIKRTDPERGDILISKDGTLGVTRLIETDAVFSIFVSLALVKPVVRDMGEFLKLAFWSPFFQERFKATGSGLLHIHLVDLRAAALPLAPVPEQGAVVGRARDMLRAIETLDATHVAANASLKTLDRSVLAKGFRGELVPQDPNDEPVGALVSQISSSIGPTKRAVSRIASKARVRTSPGSDEVQE